MIVGKEGPQAVSQIVNPESEFASIHDNIHSNFKYGVFPYWEPQHEVITLRHGSKFLSALVAIPAISTVHKIFNSQRLYRYNAARIPPILVASLLSGTVTYFTQEIFVQADIITG